MERPSKFDRAIQDKLSGMEAEPSARVWANVRDGIGAVPTASSQGNNWLRIAAAAALLIMAGTGAYFLLSPKGESTYYANSFPSTPARNWLGHPLKSQLIDTLAPAPTPLPVRSFHPNMIADKPHVPVAPQKELPAPVQEKQEIIVKQEAPLQPAPELKPVPQAAERVEVFADNSSPAAQGNKRSFKLPTADDFTVASLREKSKGLLPTLAEKAEEKLGIPAEYAHQDTDAGEMTAFSMDLGFVKFRKVRNSK